MKILAIETSCDETAVAVLKADRGSCSLEKNLVYSQIDIHQKYGGVVPELAARKHAETIIPLLESALDKNKLEGIDYLAVTLGPGLITSLILGLATAKTLAGINHLPLVGINHLEAHLYANWLTDKRLLKSEKYFPALALIVSGGHTELVLMKDHGRYQLIGQTLDDAVGEAYDKVAKLLDLDYPGGPIISRLAQEGNSEAYDFPRPMLADGFDFSFSGLKTAVLYALRRQQKISQADLRDIAASFQAAVIDVLSAKVARALNEYEVKAIFLAGGVSANLPLQAALSERAREYGADFFAPQIEYTGDNAAMIAVAAYYNIQNGSNIFQGREIFSLEPKSNWHLAKK